MKAKVEINGRQTKLILSPETDEDQLTLKEFALASHRPRQFSFYGFAYMEPDVGFVIQQPSSTD